MLQAPTADLFRDPRDLERQVAGDDVTRPVPGTDPGAAAGHHDPRPRSDGRLESALQLRFAIADPLPNATQSHPELDEAGTVGRIETYRHAGYFAPEEMDDVIARVRAASVTEPPRILANFVQRYAR